MEKLNFLIFLAAGGGGGVRAHSWLGGYFRNKSALRENSATTTTMDVTPHPSVIDVVVLIFKELAYPPRPGSVCVYSRQGISSTLSFVFSFL